MKKEKAVAPLLLVFKQKYKKIIVKISENAENRTSQDLNAKFFGRAFPWNP